MRSTRLFLLLLLTLLAACGPATSGKTPNPTNLPIVSPTAIPIPSATATPLPMPDCGARFSPAGFVTGGQSLAGLLTVMDKPGTALQLLDIQALSAQTLSKMDAAVNAAALSPLGQTFAWALPDFSIQLIHLPDGKITAMLTGHTGNINALLFSMDGKRLYSASADLSVSVWDTDSATRLASFQPSFHADNFPTEVMGLGISPDGKTLVTIPADGNARAWDTVTFKQVGEYEGNIAGGYSGAHASYSPDGKYLAIGLAGGPGDTSLWQVADQQKLWSGGMLSGFAFSPDSHLFAHTELDENNHYRIVIRTEDGQTVLQTIPALGDTMITKLIFSPDSTTLVWLDGTGLHFWDISGKRLQKSYTAPCP